MTEKIKDYVIELHKMTNSTNFKDIPINPKIGSEYINKIARFTGKKILPSFSINYETEDIDFFRAVSYKKTEEEYSNMKDFWYPDKQYIKSVGRVNFMHRQIFYCSDMQGTALFETKPAKVGTKIGLLKFRLRKNLKLMSFGLINEDDFYKNGNVEFSEKEIALNIFFGEKFKEQIPSGKEYLYYPTAIFTNLFISNKIDGFIFPSVASDLKGDNIALKTSIIDNHYQIIETRQFIVTEYNSSRDFIINCLSSSIGLNNGEIEYEKINCEGHKIDENILH